jgi:hypothetical protein
MQKRTTGASSGSGPPLAGRPLSAHDRADSGRRQGIGRNAGERDVAHSDRHLDLTSFPETSMDSKRTGPPYRRGRVLSRHFPMGAVSRPWIGSEANGRRARLIRRAPPPGSGPRARPSAGGRGPP